jgi:hypothetical protein
MGRPSVTGLKPESTGTLCRNDDQLRNRSVLEQVEQVATDSTVLIEGEPAREKNSLLAPFTTLVSAAGALL